MIILSHSPGGIQIYRNRSTRNKIIIIFNRIPRTCLLWTRESVIDQSSNVLVLWNWKAHGVRLGFIYIHPYSIVVSSAAGEGNCEQSNRDIIVTVKEISVERLNYYYWHYYHIASKRIAQTGLEEVLSILTSSCRRRLWISVCLYLFWTTELTL